MSPHRAKRDGLAARSGDDASAPRPTGADRARTAAVFAMAGPPAGLLAMLMAALLAPAGLREGSPSAGSVLAASPMLLAFAYLFGEIPALASAAVAAATTGWADRWGRFTAVNAVAGFAATAAYVLVLKPAPMASGEPLEGAWRLGLVGAFAGACCAMLVVVGRALRRRRKGAPFIIPPET